MSRRRNFDETYIGKADNGIREILEGKGEESKLRAVLTKVIQNELTERQRELIKLYYYDRMDMYAIAKEKNVTHQSVTKTIARARKRIYRIMQYYI